MSSHELVPCIIVTAFIALDFATGVVAAAMNSEITSKRMKQGLAHKFAYFSVMALAALVQWGTAIIDLGIALPIFAPVVAGICLIEITSILENCTRINPELKDSKIMSMFKSDKQ